MSHPDPYQRLAASYDRLIEPLNLKLKALGMKLSPPRPGLRVLDVGCGTGTLLERYVEGGALGFGVDASPAMLAQARRRLGGRATLLRASGGGLPFRDGALDLVTFTMVLHELDPATRAAMLDEALRVLAPAGRALVVEFHPGPLRGLKGWWLKAVSLVVERAAGRAHFAGYRHFLGLGGLAPFARERGFSVESQRVLGGGNFSVTLLAPEGATLGDRRDG